MNDTVLWSVVILVMGLSAFMAGMSSADHPAPVVYNNVTGFSQGSFYWYVQPNVACKGASNFSYTRPVGTSMLPDIREGSKLWLLRYTNQTLVGGDRVYYNSSRGPVVHFVAGVYPDELYVCGTNHGGCEYIQYSAVQFVVCGEDYT